MKLIRISKSLKEKRAVSAVISNMILLGAVITVGFAVLAWTYSRSNSYMEQYGDAVSTDIDMLREKVTFEYISYSYNATAGNLTVYIMNCGKVDAVNLTTVYVSNSSWVSRFYNINLKFLNGTSTTRLNTGEEGYFLLSSTTLRPLQTGASYKVTIITRRGSSFENAFVA
jgi:archaellum component FlaG (FlaF/FlaG flagellin family)